MVTRIGLFGEFGVGNIGNDASLEAMLAILHRRLPDAHITCICRGPKAVREKYGIDALPMNWAEEHRSQSRALDVATRLAGKPLDMLRAIRFVGRFDVVMVPGTGIFDEIGVRPWAIPYALFRLGLSAQLRHVPLGFVDVGVDPIRNSYTKWLMVVAAKRAAHRSYRDSTSRAAMSHNGVDTSRDGVFPDIAFSLPVPLPESVDSNDADADTTIGLGVMEYYGPSANPAHSVDVNERYLSQMAQLAGALLDNGYRLRLFTGSYTDIAVADEIIRRVIRSREDEVTALVFDPPGSFEESMAQMAGLSVMVASRFHNLIGAVKMQIGSISLSYTSKGDSLLRDAGLGEYTHFIETFEIGKVLDQVRLLEKRRGEVAAMLAAVNTDYRSRLEDLEDELFDSLIPTKGLT